MKKHNLSEFFKSKSFYALLSVGALAVVVIAMVGLYRSSNTKKKNDPNDLVDLNESISDVVDGNESPTDSNVKPGNDNEPPTSVTNNEDSNEKVDVTQDENKEDETSDPLTDGSLLEYDAYDPGTTEDVHEEAHEPTKVQEVMKPATLHFNHESDKLLWPVSGNVIRKYSMDSLVHHATLQQWKVSPAMLVSAEEGEEVSSAADGIISSIEEDDELGLTVTTSIGDGYSLVYGQLANLTVEEGDRVEKGQIIGEISKPTRYFTVEGTSLYFQLMKEEETLNPMLCLE